MSSEYTSPENKKEIEKMMEVLSKDLQKSRSKGTKYFVVPQTGLDLYAYIRNRPTIEIDMEGQFKLLKYVDAIKDDEAKMKSVRRIITETLTPRSPFNPFGELFNHNFFN